MSHQVLIVPLLEGVPDEEPVLRIRVIVQQDLHLAIASPPCHAPAHTPSKKCRYCFTLKLMGEHGVRGLTDVPLAFAVHILIQLVTVGCKMCLYPTPG